MEVPSEGFSVATRTALHFRRVSLALPGEVVIITLKTFDLSFGCSIFVSSPTSGSSRSASISGSGSVGCDPVDGGLAGDLLGDDSGLGVPSRLPYLLPGQLVAIQFE